jgi:hypothetical protein
MDNVRRHEINIARMAMRKQGGSIPKPNVAGSYNGTVRLVSADAAALPPPAQFAASSLPSGGLPLLSASSLASLSSIATALQQRVSVIDTSESAAERCAERGARNMFLDQGASFSTVMNRQHREGVLLRGWLPKDHHREAPFPLLDADTWPTSTDLHCWNDGHPFESRPVPAVTHYDAHTTTYHIHGVFCSFSCAKRYMIDNAALFASPNCLMWLSQFARKVFGAQPKTRPGTLYTIVAAPPRIVLKEYGGTETIESYRRDSQFHSTALHTVQAIESLTVLSKVPLEHLYSQVNCFETPFQFRNGQYNTRVIRQLQLPLQDLHDRLVSANQLHEVIGDTTMSGATAASAATAASTASAGHANGSNNNAVGAAPVAPVARGTKRKAETSGGASSAVSGTVLAGPPPTTDLPWTSYVSTANPNYMPVHHVPMPVYKGTNSARRRGGMNNGGAMGVRSVLCKKVPAGKPQ